MLTIDPSDAPLLPALTNTSPDTSVALSPLRTFTEPDDEEEDPLVNITGPLDASRSKDDPSDITVT